MVARELRRLRPSFSSISNDCLRGVLERLSSAGAILALLFFACMPPASASSPAADQPSHSTSAGTRDHAQIAAQYGKVPLSFEPNRGQADPRVQFLSRGSGYSLFLTPGEVVLSL